MNRYIYATISRFRKIIEIDGIGTSIIELDKDFNVSVVSTLEGKTLIIEAQVDGGDWSSVTQIGTADVTEGVALASCTVPSTDFDVNSNIEVRARYGIIASVAESLKIIATVTITGTPTTAGVEENLEGLSNGDEVEGFYKLSSAEEWTSAGTVSTVAGAYTIPITIAEAGSYDFKVEDTTDRDGFARVDDVTVESGRLVVDDFEQYTIGEDPIVDGDWSKSIYDDLKYSEVISEEGIQAWRIENRTLDNCPCSIAVPPNNYNNKTLKIRAREGYFNRNSFRVQFKNNNIIVLNLNTSVLIRSTTYKEFSWNISYDGEIDELVLDILTDYFSTYIDSVIIE